MAARANDAASLQREVANDPDTWKIAATSLNSLEQRCLSGLRAKGYPATSVQMDPAKLKGGYICDTMRVFIAYGQDAAHTMSAKEEAVARRDLEREDLPKSVVSRPATAILKIASPLSNDHDVAMRLRLYEREWHFYETLSSRVPIRVPTHLGSVKDEATGLITEGVLLEDLEVPGAVLCPKLDDAGVLRTVTAMARHHAQFWNMPELSSGALGLKPHNSPWYQPGWGNDIEGYWPRFEAKWRARGPAGDAHGAGLSEEAFVAGQKIVECFAWVQDALSSKPHTFNHGDVKPPNMFMMPGEMPAFIDWQYTAVGKGCQDLVFFLIEGYDVAECRRLEPIVMAHYHACLVRNGILDYSLDELKRDWQLACMHFPFYVAMWFGTTPDDALVDPGFPRRFVPRAFDAILRHGAHKLLPDTVGQGGKAVTSPPRSLTPIAVGDEITPLLSLDDAQVFGPVPDELGACQTTLVETRAALTEMRRQRDALKAALDSIVQTALSVRASVPPTP